MRRGVRAALRAVAGAVTAAALIGGTGSAAAAAGEAHGGAPATGGAPAGVAQTLPGCDGSAEYRHQNNRYTTVLPSIRFGTGLSPFDCTLGAPGIGPGPGDPGSRTGPVVVLQRALNTCYGFALPIDGVYGPQLRDAVARVQAHHGLRPDGVYAPPTRDVMEWPTTSWDGVRFCSVLT